VNFRTWSRHCTAFQPSPRKWRSSSSPASCIQRRGRSRNSRGGSTSSSRPAASGNVLDQGWGERLPGICQCQYTDCRRARALLELVLYHRLQRAPMPARGERVLGWLGAGSTGAWQLDWCRRRNEKNRTPRHFLTFRSRRRRGAQQPGFGPGKTWRLCAGICVSQFLPGRPSFLLGPSLCCAARVRACHLAHSPGVGKGR
jgi:hypothetical protein